MSKNKKLELFKNDKPIECKIHGVHTNWRIHSDNNVQCRVCATEWQRVARNKYPVKYMLKDAKQHAKTKNIIFDITEKDIEDLIINQDNKCALSGLSFDEYKFSIDKIDSSGHYTKDNIQLLTIDVNRMKSNFDEDHFINICNLVAMNAAKSPKPKQKTTKVK